MQISVLRRVHFAEMLIDLIAGCAIILKESIIVRAVKKRTDLQNVKLL